MIIRFKDKDVPETCLFCPARYVDGYYSDYPSYCIGTGELLTDIYTKPENCPAEEEADESPTDTEVFNNLKIFVDKKLQQIKYSGMNSKEKEGYETAMLAVKSWIHSETHS